MCCLTNFCSGGSKYTGSTTFSTVSSFVSVAVYLSASAALDALHFFDLADFFVVGDLVFFSHSIHTSWKILWGFDGAFEDLDLEGAEVGIFAN
jgi:hypothetical protein